MVDIEGKTATFEVGEDSLESIKETVKMAMENVDADQDISAFHRGDGTIIVRQGGNEVTIETGPQGQPHVDWTGTSTEMAENIKTMMEASAKPNGTRTRGATDAEVRRSVEASSGPEETTSSTEPTGFDRYADADFEDVEPSYDEGSLGRRSSGSTPISFSQGTVKTFGDGSIRFKPEFTKEEAKYRKPRDSEHDWEHSKCEDCAFFIEGGGCHVVQGEVLADGYCENLYSDITVSGHAHSDYVEIPLVIWGENFDWDMDDLRDFFDRIQSKVSNRLR